MQAHSPTSAVKETTHGHILLAVILLEGFVTIAVEILTIRQLIPVTGNSVLVTSLIIGVFLLFLAYGYKRGGQIKQAFAKKLKTNFLISTAFLGIGLSYPFVYIIFYYLNKIIGQHLLISLTIYLLAITAPLVYILGQTVPITMNLFKQETHVGALGGKVLHLSTVGSFLGAVCTSLILLNFLGVGISVFVCVLFLAILIIILEKQIFCFKHLFQTAILIGLIVVAYFLNIQFEHTAHVHTNAYANYRIIDQFKVEGDTGKLLIINDAPSSFITKNDKGFSYIEVMKNILFNHLKLKNQEILVLGAGGFTLTADSTHGNSVTYVDIDKDLKKVVKPEFLEQINGNIITDDARVFLTRKENIGHYKAIVSDAYNSKLSIPLHLITKEYFQSVYDALQPEGIALFNIIGVPTMTDNYSKRVKNTITAVFENCMMMPIFYVDHISNIVYACYKGGSDDNTIYTDDLNQATMDFFNAYAKQQFLVRNNPSKITD